MTFIQHQKFLSGQVPPGNWCRSGIAHRVLSVPTNKTRCGFACRFIPCKTMGWDPTYKKYYSLYHKMPTKRRTLDSRKGQIFSQDRYISKLSLTKHWYGLVLVRLYEVKNKGAAAFLEKRRVLSSTLYPITDRVSLSKEMLNGNRNITMAKLKSFQCSIKNTRRNHVYNIEKHRPIGVLNAIQRAFPFGGYKRGTRPLFFEKQGLLRWRNNGLKALQRQCLKMYFSPRRGGFFFSFNGLRIQNFFAFHSYDQKWNHKFSINIQNFRIFLNETDFPGGTFNILAKRQRFIRNSLKGILLVNFPEKEKNFLIKNLAAENKIALITQSASLLLKDSRNMDDLLGVDDPIQILFDRVKTCIPCICFINNLDRIGKQRYEQEQKSLHRLNNSISLSLDHDFTSDRIFNTKNTKQNYQVADFLTRVSSNSFSTGPLNTKALSNKQFGLNKTFNQNFKNVQNNNPTARQIFKYLRWFNLSSNKNKLKSIRPFLNLLVKLSIGSKDFMYTNSNKQLFQFSIKKSVPYFIHYTVPLRGFYKLMYYGYFVNKISSLQYKNNVLNEKYNLYPKNGPFELWPLISKSSSSIQNTIWDKKPNYILKPTFFSASPYQKPIFRSASLRWSIGPSSFHNKQYIPIESSLAIKKNPPKNTVPAFDKGKKRWVFVNTGLKKKFLVAFETRSRPYEDFLFPPRLTKKHLSDRVSKAPPRNSHRLPYWLFKNGSFFQHKINIRKVKLFKASQEDWFYDKKRKEENILTRLKARVNPLLLQLAFCQSHYNTTNPSFAKIESNPGDHQTNLENFSTISKIPLSVPARNSSQGQIKSNSTQIDTIFLKSISKKNIYDIVSQRNLSSKQKLDSLGVSRFEDLGKINTNQKQKISSGAGIFVNANMQKFNSVFSKNHSEKTNSSTFQNMGVNTEFKESTSYDSLFNTKQEGNKNNSSKITETEIIKRTALLKFLQILDGFHTTRVYKYKQIWPKAFSRPSGKGFELVKNFPPKDPDQNDDLSSKLQTRNKSSFLIPSITDFLTSLGGVLKPSKQPLFSKKQRPHSPFISTKGECLLNTQITKKLPSGSRYHIGNTGLTQNNIRFLEMKISPLRIGSAKKLKRVKKSGVNNSIMLFKPPLSHHPSTPSFSENRGRVPLLYLPKGNTRWMALKINPQTSLYQKICPKKNSLNDALQKRTFQYLRVTSKIPKWEVYLKNQPSGKSLNLLCVWPSYIDDIMGPLNINDSASYLLPEYFQLLGHGPKLKKQGITLIASTNNLATLDAALLRPGRFDTIINFSHRLSSIYKLSKIAKHSPSLIQNKIFSLSISLSIDPLTPLVSSWSFMNLLKTITNQFYPQVTVLDIPSQSISIKTFIDVSIFIHYKLWWSFHNEKAPSKAGFRIYQTGFIQESNGFRRKTRISSFEKVLSENCLNGVLKSNISVVILILKSTTWWVKKIKDVTYTFISILRMIYFQFSGRAFYFFRAIPRLKWPDKRFVTFKEKEKLALSENFDINQTRFPTEQFISNQNANQREGTNFMNSLSREVFTSKIVNLGLPHRVTDLSTLHGALDPNYIFNKEAWTAPNDKKRLRPKTPAGADTYQNAPNSILVPSLWSVHMESYNSHMEDSNIFLRANRRLLFYKGDFDYKIYANNNSEIILVKTNDFKPSRHGSTPAEIQSIGVRTAFLDSSKIWKDNGKAIASKNVNINNVMLTKYNEIYKLKKIKLKKQSFFNLHPFTKFMLQRWSQVIKSNKLKRHLKISLVNTHLPWKNEIYDSNDFDSSKLLNRKANLNNHNLKYDTNFSHRDFQLYQENKVACSASSVYLNKQRTHSLGGLIRQRDAQNSSWFPNSDIMSLCNKIYHNIYSKILLIPIPISLLKKESLKTFATNSFSTYESYIFRKLRKNFSLNIISLQIDPILTLPLKQLLEGEITDLERGMGHDFFRKFGMSSRVDNYKTRLTCKNKISNIHLLERENLLKKIPRKSVINYTYNDFQTKCKFKWHHLDFGHPTSIPLWWIQKGNAAPVFKKTGGARMTLKKNESEINNNIVLLKNLASNKKKEHDFIKTPERPIFFQKAPLENYWSRFNKPNTAGFYEMGRLDTSFFILMFYTMFFEKIQHKKITLSTIKISMPYRSLIFSHFLLSKADIYGFHCKNFEILIYNKFKNFLCGSVRPDL